MQWYGGTNYSFSSLRGFNYNHLIFGNESTGWEYLISFEYDKQGMPRSTETDSDFLEDSYTKYNNYDYDIGFGIKKMLWKKEITNKCKSNFYTGFVLGFKKYDFSYKTNSDYEYIDIDKSYSLGLLFDHNVEVFINDRFSIGFLTGLNINYQKDVSKSQNIYFDNGIIYDFNQQSSEKKKWGADISGLIISVKYYFPEE